MQQSKERHERLAPLEQLLADTMLHATGEGCPPRLAEALNWAVFPGGARIRPRLCLSVAKACGGSAKMALSPAISLELLHCASLVHDDLPCFDNAATRRGRASVQARFGERLAVLAGDALIVTAFESVSAQLAAEDPVITARLIATIARGVGAPNGIAAGQAWECENAEMVDLSVYHRAKTGSLFAAATEAGAVAAGVTASTAWAELGIRLGEAYQVADDILDAASSAEAVGKPVRQDELFSRPSSVEKYGLSGAAKQLWKLVDDAIASIPQCPGRQELSAEIKTETDRLLPEQLAAELAA